MITLYESATQVVVSGRYEELETLVNAFKFRPAGYHYAPSYERFRLSGGKEGWDGFIRPLQRIAKDACRVLRGRKQEVLNACESYSFPVDTKHLLISPFAQLTLEDVPDDLIEASFKLDDNQRLSIQQWLVTGMGNIRASVASGKTAMFAGAAALIKSRYPDARILYLTPAERLVKQVYVEMKKFLPDLEIGQFGGGKQQHGAKDMVVCTVAMLNRHHALLLANGWFDTFRCLFMDESHHSGAKSFEKIVLSVPAYFRLGASDSIKQDDLTRYNQIQGLCGPVLNDIGAAPLIRVGRIAKPLIYVVHEPTWTGKLRHVTYTPGVPSKAFVLYEGRWQEAEYLGPVYEEDEAGAVKTRKVKTADRDSDGEWIIDDVPIILQGYHQMRLAGQEEISEIPSRWCLLDRVYDRCIIQYAPRNQRVVAWAKRYSDMGWPTLVVCTRTLHIYILEALLQAVIKPALVASLFGEDTPAQRDARFNWFRQTPGAVLITPLVKEGVSINEIRAGVVADYVSSGEVANQILGRFIRKKLTGDNRAHITWFRDLQHPILRRGSNAVLKHFERLYAIHDPAPSPEEWKP